MFLLRAGSRLFLASYDPSSPKLHEYLKNLSEGARALVVEAATAMDENFRTLHNLNYDVVRVPSPLPKVADDRVYYPTVLNGLVWTTPENRQTIILPKYEGYEEDVQSDALGLIRSAFPNSRISTIEATEAAKRQGAVHCLTLVAPYEQSWFYDQARTGTYARTTNSIQDVRQKEIARILEGTWREGPVKVIITDTTIKMIAAGKTEESWVIDNLDVAQGEEDVQVTVHDREAADGANGKPSPNEKTRRTLSINCGDVNRLVLKVPAAGDHHDRTFHLRRIDE